MSHVGKIRNQTRWDSLHNKQKRSTAFNQIVVSQIRRKKILKSLHNSGISGDLGREKTYKCIKRNLYGPEMSNDVKFGINHEIFVHVQNRN